MIVTKTQNTTTLKLVSWNVNGGRDKKRLASLILSDVMGSDHCPVLLELAFTGPL
jgi:exonuclease III